MSYTYDAEAAADWRLLQRWRLRAAYSYLQIELELDADSLEPVLFLDEEGEVTDFESDATSLSEGLEGDSPHHQFSLWSSLDLAPNVELDVRLRFVDQLPRLEVDSYVGLDARLAWRPLESLELYLAGNDLLEKLHLEFPPDFEETRRSQVERGVRAGMSWRFLWGGAASQRVQ